MHSNSNVHTLAAVLRRNRLSGWKERAEEVGKRALEAAAEEVGEQLVDYTTEEYGDTAGKVTAIVVDKAIEKIQGDPELSDEEKRQAMLYVINSNKGNIARQMWEAQRRDRLTATLLKNLSPLRSRFNVTGPLKTKEELKVQEQKLVEETKAAETKKAWIIGGLSCRSDSSCRWYSLL
jgi:hypothetical protein